MTAQLARMLRAEHWAEQICSQLSKSVEAIIATGRLLVKAKADLPHGEWERMFDETLVPFGIRSAQMLMKIAEHPQLSNTNRGSYLPPSWRTLYELTTLPEKDLKNAFRDGLITPDMERKSVKALVSAPPAPRQPNPVAELANDPDDIDDDEHVATPEEHRFAFFARAEQGNDLADWPYKGPICKEVVRAARGVASSWTTLAESLESKLL